MKKFNINNHMYIRITEDGWKHLRKEVGEDYIKLCIDRDEYRHVIDGVVWHRLQVHEIFDILPNTSSSKLLFETDVMFDEEVLKNK